MPAYTVERNNKNQQAMHQQAMEAMFTSRPFSE